jgi:DNA mismatch repair protein MutL
VPRIRKLPPELISRIAAGECVERPASVVKELVENALDAGARQIDVHVQEGGRDLIQVTDDGVGMGLEDLELSVLQHATSKLPHDADLFNIHTMGFRGEALASIGAVARLQITSRSADSDVGYTIRVDAGQMTPPQPCSAPVGTRVAVRDLFYCVPARRKFLKTNQTESGHISEHVARIALAHPNVGFTLRSNQRTLHELLPTGDRRQRIRELFGAEVADTLIEISRTGTDLSIDGLVAPPQNSRGSSKWEYVFVNGRYVRDRFVSHAVKEAYRSIIDPKRYPVVFLFVTIEPEAIDVNVHPMKTEVRWRDSNYLHGQVLAALREKFLQTRLDHDLKTQQGDDDAYRERVRQAMVDFFTQSRPTGGRPDPARPATHETDLLEPARPATPASPDDDTLASRAPGSAQPPREPTTSAAPGPSAPSAAHDAADSAAADEAPTDFGQRALQVHRSYIVVETAEGLMIVDQHALHERILYEALRERLRGRTLESQRLLLPEVVSVPPDRHEALEDHAEMLGRLGIELNVVGPQSVAVQAFPTLLIERQVNAQTFVRDLLDRLSEQGARPDADTLVHDVLDMMACKAAVKAGDPLSPEEIDALLQRRERAERSSHCPHGRPTTLHMSLRDLEKQFHRR